LETLRYKSHWSSHVPPLLAAGVAVALLILTPFWAVRFVRLPFLGVFLETNNVVASLGHEGWPAFDAGVKYRDHLDALGGEPITTARDIERILAGNGYQPIEASFTRPKGSQYSVEITPIPFPFEDLVSYYIVPSLVGFVFLLIGLWAYRLRSDRWESRALLLFVSGLSIMTSTLFEISTTRYTNALWGLAVLLTAGGMMYLSLVFPHPVRMVRTNPNLRILPWLGLALFVPWMISSVLDSSNRYFYGTMWQLGYLTIVLGFILLIGTLVYRIIRAQSPLIRQQSRIIIFGTTLALTPIIFYLVMLGSGNAVPLRGWVFFPPMILMPLSITYAILRYRLLDVDAFLTRVLTYTLMTAAVLGAFFGLLTTLSLILERTVQPNNPFVIAIFLFVLVIGLNPLHNAVQRIIDRLFYRDRADYRRILTALSRSLVITPDLSQTLRTLDQELNQALNPERFVIYLYNDELGEYFPHATHEDSAPPYPAEDPLVDVIKGSENPIWIAPGLPLPAKLQPASAYVRLNGYVFVPLRYENRLIGFVALGPRRSGELYTRDDLEFLEAVAGQSTLALENARLFANLRHTLDQTLEMKNLMDDIFASMATGIITMDTKRRVTLFNHAAEKILGIPISDVIGKTLSKIVPGFGKQMEHAAEGALKGSTHVSELNSSLPQRGDLILHLSTSPLRDARLGTKGATIVIEDLTERRKLEAEQERIRQTFGRVVAPRVRDRLLADPGNLRLDGDKKMVTTLFADIAGFTTYSEKNQPEVVFKILNSYLSLAAQAILEEEGTLDKFMGDAVLALWNSPDPQEDHALRAARAALNIIHRAQEEHKVIADPAQHMTFRIGISTGPAIIGNVGTNELFNYTAIGDTVNIAQRLQSVAKPGQILIQKSTYDIIADKIIGSRLDAIFVKGREQAIDVYSLEGLK
jgi:PAS domain S-box-containing protein